MKRIYLKDIHLVNFKGIRDRAFEFGKDVNTLAGDNGTGKTTVFDAFTWLLFGKDSQDRKSFEIKTLDINSVAIPRLPHEVSATLLVGDQAVSLRRLYTEKWQRKRGQEQEEFTGHKEEFFFNDVPCTLKEYNEKIEGICSGEVFKLITNPSYFVSQKPEVQRAMLFRMAGEIDIKEICEGNEDFTAIVNELTGKTLEEYKREIASKKAIIKKKTITLPELIQENARNIAKYEEIDFAAKAQEETELTKRLEELKAVMQGDTADRTAADALLKAQQKLMQIESDVKLKVEQEYQTTLNAQKTAIMEKEQKEREVKLLKEQIAASEQQLQQFEQTRQTLRVQWKQIKAEQAPVLTEAVCPVCRRQLEGESLAAHQREVEENFNQNKAARLREVESKGCQVAEQMKSIKQGVDEVMKVNLAKLEEALNSFALPEVKDNRDKIAVILDSNSEYAEITNQIKEMQNNALKTQNNGNSDAVRAEIKQLEEQLSAVKVDISKLEVIKETEARIKELDAENIAASQELSALEKVEFNINAFNKARVTAIEDRIDSMFTLVHFKMYQEQINGGEVETCEAMVNGVPYSSLNQAMKINAGLDIIGTICNVEGITAPIFIDNAEGINDILETDSQQIRLRVSKDAKLKLITK